MKESYAEGLATRALSTLAPRGRGGPNILRVSAAIFSTTAARTGSRIIATFRSGSAIAHEGDAWRLRSSRLRA
jgi:hypothetical protein